MRVDPANARAYAGYFSENLPIQLFPTFCSVVPTFTTGLDGFFAADADESAGAAKRNSAASS